MLYFSEREDGEIPRSNDEISNDVWLGIRSLIQARVEDGSFGASYPENCFDGPIPIGTDREAFNNAMRAHIPGLPDWPWAGQDKSPLTPTMLDMIEFCWRCVGEPIQLEYHDYGNHNHLRFDIAAGRRQFSLSVEEIFRRNGIAYRLTPRGCIERVVPPVLHEDLIQASFRTDDPHLNKLLDTATRKYIDRNPESRKEGLDLLWDAWERLKTLGGGDKKTQTLSMLDDAAGNTSPKFRAALEKEAKELTKMGNQLSIRHTETDQEQLARTEHVDYLFHRMFSLVNLVLQTK